MKKSVLIPLSEPEIDFVSIVAPLTKEWLQRAKLRNAESAYTAITAAFEAAIKSKKINFKGRPAKRTWYSQPRYRRFHRIPIPNGGWLTIGIRPLEGAPDSIFFEFAPQIPENFLLALLPICSRTLPMELWKTLLLNAKVTRIDVAVDAPDVYLGDYIWSASHARNVQCYRTNGFLQGIELGSRKSEYQRAIYDSVCRNYGNNSWTPESGYSLRVEWRTMKGLTSSDILSANLKLDAVYAYHAKQVRNALLQAIRRKGQPPAVDPYTLIYELGRGGVPAAMAALRQADGPTYRRAKRALEPLKICVADPDRLSKRVDELLDSIRVFTGQQPLSVD